MQTAISRDNFSFYLFNVRNFADDPTICSKKETALMMIIANVTFRIILPIVTYFTVSVFIQMTLELALVKVLA